MATPEQMKALLAVPCTWCGASPGQRCFVKVGRRVTVPSTLDGESHDARWQRALGMQARVLTALVEERRPARHTQDEPVAVGATVTAATPKRQRIERPW